MFKLVVALVHQPARNKNKHGKKNMVDSTNQMITWCYNGDVMAISYEDMNQESWDVMENRQGV